MKKAVTLILLAGLCSFSNAQSDNVFAKSYESSKPTDVPPNGGDIDGEDPPAAPVDDAAAGFGLAVYFGRRKMQFGHK